MANNNVLLNSSSHDGMVCLTAEDQEQLSAIILPLVMEVMMMRWIAVNSCG